ncbi:hypothetical protein B0I35DRAFT_477066 [Stachybotrys elegans]|uniref:Xylanolytic transcriptional activator regulatory domain-containing protein n=1 Tax=Stachybotrys elegans TaxID=80388 RepID=A0A8K0SUL4_9HYPO|nr:hypothetical protein B0I35DRAFT_477066 [Stachybotrys elegans]
MSSLSDAMVLMPAAPPGPTNPSSVPAPATPSFSFDRFAVPRKIGFRDSGPASILDGITRAARGYADASDILLNANPPCLPVSQWTQISVDDARLTHILNLFWSWDHHVSRMIHREIFHEALKAGTQGAPRGALVRTEFCSSFMVNAMLAVGCMYSTEEVNFAVPGDVKTRGRKFADEAARLLEIDRRDWPISLTTVQGTILLWIYESNIGDGNLGLRLLDDGYRLYGVLLDTFRADQPQQPSSAQRQANSWEAISQFAWGTYWLAAKIDLTFSRPMRIRKPTMQIPTSDSGSSPFSGHLAQGSWVAYPMSLETQDSLYAEVFVAECQLAQLIDEVLTFREQSRSVSMTQEGIRRLYAKLVHWKESLPGNLQPFSTELPYVLLLHNTHDSLFLKLVEGLRSIPSTELSGQSLDTLRIAHAASIMAGVWTFRALYSIRREYWAMQGCFAAAVAMLEYLVPGTVQVDTFAKACQALTEIGELLPLANSFLEGIKGLVKLSKVSIPRYGSKYLLDRRTTNVYTSSIRVSALHGQGEGGIDGQDRDGGYGAFTFSELLSDLSNPQMQVD